MLIQSFEYQAVGYVYVCISSVVASHECVGCVTTRLSPIIYMNNSEAVKIENRSSFENSIGRFQVARLTRVAVFHFIRMLPFPGPMCILFVFFLLDEDTGEIAR